jgi:hypothetical protein
MQVLDHPGTGILLARVTPTSGQRPVNLQAKDPVNLCICIIFALLFFHSDGALARFINLRSDIVGLLCWFSHDRTNDDQHHRCDNLHEKSHPCQCVFLLAKPTLALQAKEGVILALGKLQELCPLCTVCLPRQILPVITLMF